jgi:hypothetical protein
MEFGNCLCVEASYPADLSARVNAELAAWAATAHSFPYLQSWEIAAAGNGASWRANVQMGSNADWGLMTSVPAGIAHFICREAQHFEQLTAVQNQMLAAIATATQDGGYVVGTKICGPKGNGTYLVAMLYVDGVGQAPTTHVASYAPQLNLNVDTIVSGLFIANAFGSNQAYHHTYAVYYAMEVADDVVAATGVSARVILDLATLYEDNWAAAAGGEWRTFSGHHYCVQDAVNNQQFQLEVAPGAGNTVSVRAVRLDAILINHHSSDA